MHLNAQLTRIEEAKTSYRDNRAQTKQALWFRYSPDGGRTVHELRVLFRGEALERLAQAAPRLGEWYGVKFDVFSREYARKKKDGGIWQQPVNYVEGYRIGKPK